MGYRAEVGEVVTPDAAIHGIPVSVLVRFSIDHTADPNFTEFRHAIDGMTPEQQLAVSAVLHGAELNGDARRRFATLCTELHQLDKAVETEELFTKFVNDEQTASAA